MGPLPELSSNFLENSMEIHSTFFSEDSTIFSDVLSVIDEYGSVKKINWQGKCNASYNTQKKKLAESPYLEGLEWLEDCVTDEMFVSAKLPVTLEISACNHFQWLIKEAQQAIEKQEIMPSRFIRVRSLKEQEKDDLVAFHAAMNLLGASSVQTLGTKGTQLDKAGNPINVHLAGPGCIAGYFGGVGIPNDWALEWLRELLFYYTEYGINEVLNVNYGTFLLGLVLYKLGVDVKFKVSVFMGIDNPYSAMNILMLAKQFSRPDGSCGLAGLNLSNSVNNQTILEIDEIRRRLGLEDYVRIEHHITEAYQGIVRQPYDRLAELCEIAGKVKNFSAKHEGGIPSVEQTRSHPSNILDYFLKPEERNGLQAELLQNYLDKHDAVVRTANALSPRKC